MLLYRFYYLVRCCLFRRFHCLFCKCLFNKYPFNKRSFNKRPLNKKHITKIGFLLSLISLVSCQSTEEWRMSKLPVEYHGLWQSNGYGYLIDARHSQLKSYHVTPDVCVRDEDIEEAFYVYASQQVEGVKFVVSEDGQNLYLSDPFEDYKIQFTRLEHLPEQCKNLTVNTPKATFDAFSSYMKTHYAFFDLYDVNWSEIVASYETKVTEDMEDEALFDLFSEMLSPINDAHVSLQGVIHGEEKSYSPEISPVGEATKKLAEQLNTSKDKIDEKLFEQYWLQDIQKTILQNQGVMAANNWIQYGIVSGKIVSGATVSKNTASDKIGYMAIAATYDYADGGLNDDAADRQQLNQVLDHALTLFNKNSVKAVLLDLSINFGGHSFPATDIASRFAVQSTLAFSKKAYDASGVEAFPIHISPSHVSGYVASASAANSSSAAGSINTATSAHKTNDVTSGQSYFHGSLFHGPVYVLASSVTVSGGEEIVLALKALPNVTLVGERTRGALSDILDKKLPNGWRLALSNEIYTDENGMLWEGDGIPPELEIPVFDRENPFKGHVEAVDLVIQKIQQEVFLQE